MRLLGDNKATVLMTIVDTTVRPETERSGCRDCDDSSHWSDANAYLCTISVTVVAHDCMLCCGYSIPYKPYTYLHPVPIEVRVMTRRAEGQHRQHHLHHHHHQPVAPHSPKAGSSKGRVTSLHRHDMYNGVRRAASEAQTLPSHPAYQSERSTAGPARRDRNLVPAAAAAAAVVVRVKTPPGRTAPCPGQTNVARGTRRSRAAGRARRNAGVTRVTLPRWAA